MHGLNKVYTAPNTKEKVFWFICFLGTMIFSTYILCNLCQRYLKYQTDTDITIYEKNTLPIPAITLCAMSKVRENRQCYKNSLSDGRTFCNVSDSRTLEWVPKNCWNYGAECSKAFKLVNGGECIKLNPDGAMEQGVPGKDGSVDYQITVLRDLRDIETKPDQIKIQDKVEVPNSIKAITMKSKADLKKGRREINIKKGAKAMSIMREIGIKPDNAIREIPIIRRADLKTTIREVGTKPDQFFLYLGSPGEPDIIDGRGDFPGMQLGRHYEIAISKNDFKRLPPPHESNCAESRADINFLSSKYTTRACKESCYLLAMLKKCGTVNDIWAMQVPTDILEKYRKNTSDTEKRECISRFNRYEYNKAPLNCTGCPHPCRSTYFKIEKIMNNTGNTGT